MNVFHPFSALALVFRLNTQEPALHPPLSPAKPADNPPYVTQPGAIMSIPLVRKNNVTRQGLPKNARLVGLVFNPAATQTIDFLEVRASESTPYFTRGEFTWLTPQSLFKYYEF